MRHDELVCVAVDWSGAKGRSARLALAEARGGRLLRVETLHDREQVCEAIEAYHARREAVVVGIDFSFSFPAWFVDRLGATDAIALWPIVEAEGERWLRECPSPFWGRPGTKRPGFAAPLLRRTEADVARRLRSGPASPRPKSTFQIGGAGAVGTSSIRGMPRLLRLRAAGFAIWPFDAAAHHTVVELYPRALTGPVVKSDPTARASHVARLPWTIPPALARKLTESEDAFDAGVSALGMSACADSLLALPPGDAIDRIEGRIWIPDPMRVVAARRSGRSDAA